MEVRRARGADTAGRDAVMAAVRHVNASARDEIEAETLLDALKGERVPAPWAHHVSAFLDETDVESLSDIVRAGMVDYARLAHHARQLLPPGHDTLAWLDERA